MKHKINEFKDFIFTRLEDQEELSELCDLLLLDIEDEASKHIIMGRLFSICSAIADGYIDDTMSRAFNQVFELRDYASAYTIIKDLFFHYFLAITVELVGNEKNLERHLLIPIRSSLGDVMYAILAAFRADGEHLVELVGKDYCFEPTATKAEESDCADEFPSFVLYDLKNPRVAYDFGESYEFRIKMRKPKRVEGEECWDSVIVEGGKGYGIIEESHYALDTYFEKGSFDDGSGEYDEKLDVNLLLIDSDRDYHEIALEELRDELEGSFQYIREKYIFGDFYNEGIANSYDDLDVLAADEPSDEELAEIGRLNGDILGSGNDDDTNVN